ncbi:hypothetical protein A9G45_00430 [Gilliamella sp. HK2]|uniref:hypothetical protein n=1 Tax=unclassified Gilliamella TaxID=2685620 RepID=UPI00080DF0B9|nr:hypothetical protein [Gilliamella apicola]OCG31330.1 hypothetical protein A9G46_10735 [Gilliamella apicola]OCG32787.1 hypothetical protein A9G45_00430 [Gilliamella apicola]
MKKLVIIGLVSLALFGCGEDKITKEFLVGDWRCKDNQYQRHNVGANEDLGDPVSSIEDTTTFRIINNELYQISKKTENTLIDLSKIDSTEDEVSDTYKTHIVNTIKAIDKDTFKTVLITEIKDINNDTNIINFRTKLETVCTRIK